MEMNSDHNGKGEVPLDRLERKVVEYWSSLDKNLAATCVESISARNLVGDVFAIVAAAPVPDDSNLSSESEEGHE